MKHIAWLILLVHSNTIDTSAVALIPPELVRPLFGKLMCPPPQLLVAVAVVAAIRGVVWNVITVVVVLVP